MDDLTPLRYTLIVTGSKLLLLEERVGVPDYMSESNKKLSDGIEPTSKTG